MIIRDKDGNWRKIINSEVVTEDVIQAAVERYQANLEDLRNGTLEQKLLERLQHAQEDLEDIQRGAV